MSGWLHAWEKGYPTRDELDLDGTAARFWAKVDRSGGDAACWPWLAYRNPKGYGRVSVQGTLRVAHRVAYEFVIGEVPAGLQLDHLCRNPPCVNPAHLEPVTARENQMRGNGVAAQSARKTHCPKGHPYSGDNLALTPRGSRECRECHRVPAAVRRLTMGQVNAAKTHCVNGHEFTPANTRITVRRNGPERVCRTCALMHNRASRARRAGEVR